MFVLLVPAALTHFAGVLLRLKLLDSGIMQKAITFVYVESEERP